MIELNIPDWSGGLCAQTDPELFWPQQKGGSNAAAKKVCSGCPVREACLEYALVNHEDGFWGGTSVKERQAIRRDRKQAA